MKAWRFWLWTGLILGAPAVVASDAWQPMQGPFGGQISSIAVLSAQEIVAAGLEGGVFRSADGGDRWTRVWPAQAPRPWRLLHRGDAGLLLGTTDGLYLSTDGGTTWTGLALSGEGVLEIAANSAGHIYAITSESGLVRSTDDGATWAGLDVGEPYPTVVAVDSGDRVFVGTALGGLYRSTDGGEAWLQVRAPWTGGMITAIAFGVVDELYVGDLGSGVRRSRDAGLDWIFAGLVNRFITALAIGADGRVFAATGGDGLYRSRSGAGNDWVRADLGVEDRVVAEVVAGPDGRVLAGTGGSGLVRSIDHGDHWTPANENLAALQVLEIVVDSQGRVLAGTRYGGVLRSDDGVRWSQVGLVDRDVLCFVEDSDGSYLCGTPWGVFRSRDGGAPWGPAGLRDDVVTALWGDPSGFLLAGTAWNGLFVTTDHGTTWSPSSDGLGNPSVYSLAALPGGVLLAGTGDGVFASDDRGAHWSARGLAGTLVRRVVVDSRGRTFAQTSAELQCSTDGGAHWERIVAPEGTRSFAVAVDGLDQVWLGTSGGVYLSADGGATWTAANDGLPMESIFVLGIDPRGHVFAQGLAGPVYRRSISPTPVEISDFTAEPDPGGVLLRWRAVRTAEVTRFRVLRSRAPAATDLGSSGLQPDRTEFEPVTPDVGVQASPSYVCRDAAPHPGRERYRLLALGADGSTVASRETELLVTAPMRRNRLLGNQPNPFNPTTVLHFSLAGTGPAAVDVIDARGRFVRSLWRAGNPAAGDHQALWDGRDGAGRLVASGTYWSRLVVGGRVVGARAMTLVR